MSNVGITSEILDGNLTPVTSLPDDTVVVVSRSTIGPANQVYRVTDFETAKTVFGATSPIIQLMKHVYAPGAKNVVLYRIGAKEASITNLFGNYSALRTTSAFTNADANLKVYSGPRASDPTKTDFIVYSGSKVVYSNVPGRTINEGIVSLEGFDESAFNFIIGTPTTPVDFKSVTSNLKAKTVDSFTGNGTLKAFSLTNSGSFIISVVSSTAAGVTTTLNPTTDYTYATGTVTLTTAPATGTTVQVTYASNVSASTYGIQYQAASDGMNANLNKLYEFYDSAFVDLEAYDVFSVVVEDLFGCRNIASGDDNTQDRLTYVYRIEDVDGFKYEWSDNKYLYQSKTNANLTTSVLADAALDSNNQPIVVKQYRAVDFAHRLATYCYSQSSFGRYVNGVIGPKGPAGTFTLAINRWIGTAPVKDSYGNITVNGTGLLGNRFLAGTTTQKPGFFATDGYPDGDSKVDGGGVLIDIGKHLSIPVTPVYLTSDAYSTSGITTRSSSGAYAGLITQIAAGDSTTNVVVNGVTPVFKIKSAAVKALSNIGYVVMTPETLGTTVYSGELATRDESDYDYISTAIAVTRVLANLREVINPYIGKGLSETSLAALHNAIDTDLKASIKAGYINGSSFNLIGTSVNDLRLPLRLKPKHELRSVNIQVSLAPQDLYSI